MKTTFEFRRRFAGAARWLGLLLITAAPAARADFGIDWYTVDGGGGRASGGSYRVTGTIGQPDTGTMANGPYTVAGGFWSMLGIRPWLRIWVAGTDVVVAWPVTAAPSQLQQAGNVAVPGWSDVLVSPVVVGEEYQVTLPLAGFQQYFRLIKL